MYILTYYKNKNTKLGKHTNTKIQKEYTEHKKALSLYIYIFDKINIPTKNENTKIQKYAKEQQYI